MATRGRPGRAGDGAERGALMAGVYSEFRSFALAAACADPLRIMTARVAAAPMIWSDGRSGHGVPARRPG